MQYQTDEVRYENSEFVEASTSKTILKLGAIVTFVGAVPAGAPRSRREERDQNWSAKLLPGQDYRVTHLYSDLVTTLSPLSGPTSEPYEQGFYGLVEEIETEPMKPVTEEELDAVYKSLGVNP